MKKIPLLFLIFLILGVSPNLWAWRGRSWSIQQGSIPQGGTVTIDLLSYNDYGYPISSYFHLSLSDPSMGTLSQTDPLVTGHGTITFTAKKPGKVTINESTTYSNSLNIYNVSSFELPGGWDIGWDLKTNYVKKGNSEPLEIDLWSFNGMDQPVSTTFNFELSGSGSDLGSLNTTTITVFGYGKIYYTPKADPGDTVMVMIRETGRNESKKILYLQPVKTNEDLTNIKNHPDWGYYLDNSIDMRGADFTPIMNYSGVFEGNGFEIKNLKIDTTLQDLPGTGLFGSIKEHAIIQDLIMKNVVIKGKNQTGAVAGFATNRSRIINCSVEGNVKGGENVGGVVGCMEDYTHVLNSRFDGEVRGEKFVGGVSGSTAYGFIYKSRGTGRVIADGDTAGGVAGGIYCSEINNSYTYSEIYGKDRIGGLTGFIKDASVYNSYARGKIFPLPETSFQNTGGLIGVAELFDPANKTVVSTSYSAMVFIQLPDGQSMPNVGGFVGNAKPGTQFTSDCWDTSITQNIFTTGPISGVTGSSNLKTVVGWDSGVWEILNGISYPFFRDSAIPIGTQMDFKIIESKPEAEYFLTNDVNLAPDYSIIVDTSATQGFQGILDGKGHIIHNFTKSIGTSCGYGLFDLINKGTVRRLGMENVNIVLEGAVSGMQGLGDLRYGTLARTIENGSIIEECHVIGKISNNDLYSGGSFGGIIGYSSNSFIRNCYTDIQVGNKAPKVNFGGIAGSFSGGGIETSYAHIEELPQEDFININCFIGDQAWSGGFSNYWYSESNNILSPAQATKLNEENMKKQASFDWDFDNIWEMRPDRFPCLKIERWKAISDIQGLKDLYFNFSGHYYLNNSIDCLPCKDFKPLGFGTSFDMASFSGSFDGCDKEISNLSLSKNADLVGLFGRIFGATISNLIISKSEITGNDYIGSLAAYSACSNIKNVHINNCKINGKNYVGGVIGYGTDTNLEECSVACTEKGGEIIGNDMVGGVLGRADLSSSFREISNRHVNVTGTTHVGGLVGLADTNGGPVCLTDSYVHDSIVTSTGSYTGGLIGYCAAAQMTINDCYVLDGSISGQVCTGGLVGGGILSIINCYAAVPVDGDNSTSGSLVGGLVSMPSFDSFFYDKDKSSMLPPFGNGANFSVGRATKEMMKQATFEGWDFNQKWIMAGYPHLKSECTTEISEAYQLQLMQVKSGAHYMIMNDIDCSETTLWNDGNGFTPIKDFTGSLKCMDTEKGACLSSLSINRSEEVVGLFATLKGSIDFVNFVEPTVKGGSSKIGVLAGENQGVITRCSVNAGEILGGVFTGGIVGINGGTISQSSVKGHISVSANGYTGGITGNNTGDIINSYAMPNLDISLGNTCGGCTGRNSGTIKYCYSQSIISGAGSKGGVTGLDESGSYTKCFWDHDLANLPAINSSSTGSLEGVESKSSADMNTQETYAVPWGDSQSGGIFQSIDGIRENDFWRLNEGMAPVLKYEMQTFFFGEEIVPNIKLGVSTGQSPASIPDGKIFSIKNGDNYRTYARYPGPVTIKWPTPGENKTVRYLVLDKADPKNIPCCVYHTHETKQDLSKDPAITNVPVVDLSNIGYGVNVLYNSNIDATSLIINGNKVYAKGKTGPVIFLYTDKQNQNIPVDFDVVNVKNHVDNDYKLSAEIGSKLSPKIAPQDLSRYKVFIGEGRYEDGGYIENHEDGLYAVKENRSLYSEMEVFWIRNKALANGDKIEWPYEFDGYTADWPKNPVALYHTHYTENSLSTGSGIPLPQPQTPSPLVDLSKIANIYWGNTSIDIKLSPEGKLYAAGKTGGVLFKYYDSKGNFIGFETIDVRFYDETQHIKDTVNIGSRLLPDRQYPGEMDIPVVTKGLDLQSSENSYVYQHRNEKSLQNGQIFAIKKTSTDADIEVYWTRRGTAGVIWPYELHRYNTRWPSSPSDYQNYVRGSNEQATGMEVEINKELKAELMPFQDPANHASLTGNVFSTDIVKYHGKDPDTYTDTYNNGCWSLLKYLPGNDVRFQVVRSIFHDDKKYFSTTLDHDIGVEIRNEYHQTGEAPADKPGYVYVDPGKKPFKWDRYDPVIYQGDGAGVAGTGQIFPVNEGTLEVWWCNLIELKGYPHSAVQWPSQVTLYDNEWTGKYSQIIIASEKGSGLGMINASDFVNFNPSKLFQNLLSGHYIKSLINKNDFDLKKDKDFDLDLVKTRKLFSELIGKGLLQTFFSRTDLETVFKDVFQKTDAELRKAIDDAVNRTLSSLMDKEYIRTEIFPEDFENLVNPAKLESPSGLMALLVTKGYLTCDTSRTECHYYLTKKILSLSESSQFVLDDVANEFSAMQKDIYNILMASFDKSSVQFAFFDLSTYSMLDLTGLPQELQTDPIKLDLIKSKTYDLLSFSVNLAELTPAYYQADGQALTLSSSFSEAETKKIQDALTAASQKAYIQDRFKKLSGPSDLKIEGDEFKSAKSEIYHILKASYFLDTEKFVNTALYFQNDPQKTGFNPNDEHAFIMDSGNQKTIFALRCDLSDKNDSKNSSEPYVLMKYQNAETNLWDYRVFKVYGELGEYSFTFPKKAGTQIDPPYPLSTFQKCSKTYGSSGPYFRDRKGTFWAMAAKDDGDVGSLAIRYYYQVQPGFYFPPSYATDSGKPLPVSGEEAPWLDLYRFRSNPSSGTPGTPEDIKYTVYWPDDLRMPWPLQPEIVPSLKVGETLVKAKFGLPEISDQSSVQILYQQSKKLDQTGEDSVLLIDPTRERSVPIQKLPADSQMEMSQGKYYFSTLPPQLKERFFIDPSDPTNMKLKFLGKFVEAMGVREPKGYLLLNVISEREYGVLQKLSADFNEQQKNNPLYNLYSIAKDPILVNQNAPIFDSLALTAGNAKGTGYVALAFGNNSPPSGEAEPIQVQIIKVTMPLYVGDLKVIENSNPFDEKLTLRHTGDFSAKAGDYVFDWRVEPPVDGLPKTSENLPYERWTPYFNSEDPKVGALDLTIIDNGVYSLKDNYFIARYIRKKLSPPFFKTVLGDDQKAHDLLSSLVNAGLAEEKSESGETTYTLKNTFLQLSVKGIEDAIHALPLPAIFTEEDRTKIIGLMNWSDWTFPMLAEGWIKRVMKGITPFEQRIKDFEKTEVNTTVSMISQAGERWTGNVPLNLEAANKQGLIPIYETVLKRGTKMYETVPNDPGIDDALLLAASRISDLYNLLGNEAYSDACDPTIAYGAEGQYGAEASSLHCFMNQTKSLLEEELGLLRGRDDSLLPNTRTHPFYNRFIWNFSNDMVGGETAYTLNYGIWDIDRNGVIDENDARLMYPQGHGDAWGHYLTAVTGYYNLMLTSNFKWIPRIEAVLIGGVPVSVDYYDERKFAKTAASKAECGVDIVNLTYRNCYVENPDGKWQGLEDTGDNEQKKWGVSDWASRAGEGAFIDWVMANSLLPASNKKRNVEPAYFKSTVKDPAALYDFLITLGYLDANGSVTKKFKAILSRDEEGKNAFMSDMGSYYTFDEKNSIYVILQRRSVQTEGIQDITRASVPELGSLASAFLEIQTQMDNADLGLNPLGLSKNAMLFDISPSAVDQGKTHFEQIYDRSITALNNALAVFNHACNSSQILRRQSDSVSDFKKAVENQEADFNSRLIDLYGTPYEDDIGPGGTYKQGYNGPDLYHYAYVDNSEFTGYTPDSTRELQVFFRDASIASDGTVNFTASPVKISLNKDTYEVIKPVTWKGKRSAPGEIQRSLASLIQTRVSFLKGIQEYDNLCEQLYRMSENLKKTYFLNATEISIMQTSSQIQLSLDAFIMKARMDQLAMRKGAEIASLMCSSAAECFPTDAGMACDVMAPARGAVKIAGTIISQILTSLADISSIVELGLQQGKEIDQQITNIKLAVVRQDKEILQSVEQIEQLVKQILTYRYELVNQRDGIVQAAGNYRASLAKGIRLVDDRTRFRQQTAAKIQDYRYKDMSFRIFRNDALQKYRAQFDLASKYVYLAAEAYDYESNLLKDDPRGGGENFMTDIVRSRTIGLIANGIPQTGSGIGDPGLAEPLAKMYFNWELGLKGQLGFNNPSTETGRFSLRTECFRILPNSQGDEVWKQKLRRMVVSNLFSIPEFNRYCIPFTPHSNTEPGLVIPFSSCINFGQNFFGWPAGGGDNSYDSTNFSTKIRSVGVWFSNYNNLGEGISNTPRVYLIPAGNDIQRSPTNDYGITREWKILDQKIPVPFPLKTADLNNPLINLVSQSMNNEDFIDIRKFPMFRAYHDSGNFNASETINNSRLIGRSVWNTQWFLIIPAGALHVDRDEGLNRFIFGKKKSDGTRDGNGVSDIKLFFQTYSYSGN